MTNRINILTTIDGRLYATGVHIETEFYGAMNHARLYNAYHETDGYELACYDGPEDLAYWAMNQLGLENIRLVFQDGYEYETALYY